MNKLRRTVQEYPVLSFVLLSIGISWPVWGLQLVTSSSLFASASVIPQFGPLIAAGALVLFTGSDLQAWANQISRWQAAPYWYGFAIVLPLLCNIGVVIGSALLLNGPWTVPFLELRTLGGYVVTLVSYMIYALGVEVGFRGFALPRLQRRYTALGASAIIALAWAVWSLPLLYFPWSYLSTFSIFVYMPALLIFSVLLTYIYNSTGGSVLVATVLGGGIRTAVGLSVVGAFSVGMQLMTLAIWAIPALTIANLYGEKRLADQPPVTENAAGTLDR